MECGARDYCCCESLGKVGDSTWEYLLSWNYHTVRINKLKKSFGFFIGKFYYQNIILRNKPLEVFIVRVINSKLTYGSSCWKGTYLTFLKPLLVFETVLMRKLGYR